MCSQCYFLQGPDCPASLQISRILQKTCEVHQDDSHLVSGDLSHRKALSVAKVFGQKHSARELDVGERC